MAAKRQHRRESGDEGFVEGPERQCVVTRASFDAECLIRFVRAPDGTVVPDLDRSLPGRGLWVTARRDILRKAVESKGFARGFRSEVHVPADFPEMVEGLMLRRLTDNLSLANKAGLVIAGFAKIDAALDKGPLAALVHGLDGATDGQGKLDRKFGAIQRENHGLAPVCRILTVEHLSLALGRPSVVHAGLLPGGLTDRFLREAERLERFRAASDSRDQNFLRSNEQKAERTDA